MALQHVGRMKEMDTSKKFFLYKRHVLVHSILQVLYFFSWTVEVKGDDILCDLARHSRSGLCYRAEVNNARTYAGAVDFCTGNGGSLARVPDSETLEFIKYNSLLSSQVKGEYWIGLDDTDNDGVYTWSNTSTLGTYPIWSNKVTSECVLYDNQTFTWNGDSCTRELDYICEFVTTRCGSLQGYSSPGISMEQSGDSTKKVISYNCDDGYNRVSGRQFWWECTPQQKDNLFTPSTGVLPTCAARTCSVAVTNGTVNSTETLEPHNLWVTGDKVVVQCEEGFNVTDPNELTVVCNTTNGWTDVPQCTPFECNLTMTTNLPDNLTIVPNAYLLTTTSGFDISSYLLCSPGYNLTWPANKPQRMNCDEDGTWTNVPTCEPNSCTTITMDNGNLVTTPAGTAMATGVGFSVTCDAGYEITGAQENDTELICEVTGAWSQDIRCNPTDCLSTELVITNHLQIIYGNQYPRTGTTVAVTCMDGYYLNPDPAPAMMCNTNTQVWENRPTCNAYSCGPLEVTNGTVNPASAMTTGTQITVTCVTGYTWEITNQQYGVICGAANVWANPTPCLPNTCINPTFQYASSVVFPDGQSQTGQTPTVACEEGFRLDNTAVASAICDTDGTWTNPPPCLANSCGTLNVATGTVSSPTGRQSGDMVDITCDSGYYVTSAGINYVVKCHEDETWINPATCQGYACNDTQISNAASLSFDNAARSGSQPTVQCQTGYSLIPDTLSTAMCQSNGVWSNKPQCIPNNCTGAQQESVANAVSVSFPVTTIVSGTIPTITCQAGFSVNVTSMVCLSDGSWANKPSCSRGDCPAFTIPNSQTSIGMGMFGDTAQVVCNTYYGLSTSNGTITCSDDKTWTPTVTCEPNNCSAPTVANAATLEFQDGLAQTGKQVVSFTCSTGYLPVPSNPSTVQCQADGTWVNEPTCQRKVCELLTIVNGDVVHNGTKFGDVATITCRPEYKRTQGNGQVTCGDNGKWTPPHSCEVNECNALTMANAELSVTSGVQSDASININCSQGFVPYDFTNPYVMKCAIDGIWINRPTCVSGTAGSTCQDHGILNVQTLPIQPIRDFATTFQCNTGFILQGPQQVTCSIDDGSWSVLPECLANECKDLTIENAAEPITGATSGSVVTLNCNKGYSSSISPPIRPNCTANREWLETPSCQANVCPGVTITNGNLEPSDVATGSQPVLTCNANYIALGVTSAVCLSSGNLEVKPECLACQDCLTSYNNNYPDQLLVFANNLPNPNEFDAICENFYKYDSCLDYSECSSTKATTDNLWAKGNLLLTWLCPADNLQGVTDYKPCLEKALSTQAAVDCRSKLMALTAGDTTECSGASDNGAYFTCLSDTVKSSTDSECQTNKQQAGTWLADLTQNADRVPPSYCNQESGGINTVPTLLWMMTCILTGLAEMQV